MESVMQKTDKSVELLILIAKVDEPIDLSDFSDWEVFIVKYYPELGYSWAAINKINIFEIIYPCSIKRNEWSIRYWKTLTGAKKDFIRRYL